MSELGAGELPVPAFRSERLAKNRLSGRLLRFSLAADVSFKVGSLPPKRNDLDDWGPTFQHMQSIRPGCEEGRMDLRLIGVGIDDACDHFEHPVGTVERRDEKTTPAGRRANGPVIVVTGHKWIVQVGAVYALFFGKKCRCKLA